MHSYLITGKTKSQRAKEAEKLLKETSIKEVVRLQPEGKHSIEDIRNLNHILSFSPQDPEKGRGVIVFEANLLTPEAANSFLKTLEDPPGKTIIILTSANKDLVIETIASRTEIIDLGLQELELSETDQKAALKDFEKLTTSTPGEKFIYADKFSDRKETLDFCAGQIWAAHQVLINSSNKKVNKIADLLETLEQTRLDLEANVNVKLAIFELILNYPNL